MDDWELLDRETVLQGERPVERRRYRTPDGTAKEIDVTLEGAGAAVLARTVDGRVVLVRQFRPGPGATMLDLPGGFLDAGEDPADAATRELREETGYVAGSVRTVGLTRPAAYTDEARYVVLAEGCRPGGGKDTDDGESTETVLLTVPELREHLVAGDLVTTDAAYLALDAAGLL